MRLDVYVVGAEQLLRALDRQRLDLVDDLAGAAVVAPAGIALGVLVREQGAQRLEDGGAGQVFRRDQLERLRLPSELVADELRDLRIFLVEGPESHGGDGWAHGGDAIPSAVEAAPGAPAPGSRPRAGRVAPDP